MGREIRMVPKGWEHPKGKNGEFMPMFDEDFESAAREWLDSCILWDNNEHETLYNDPNLKKSYPFYWQWAGQSPSEEYYRPKFENANCFQIYENVTEGTPVSPVFESKHEMFNWLVSEGYPEEAARTLIEYELAPSMMVRGGKIAMNIDQYYL